MGPICLPLSPFSGRPELRSSIQIGDEREGQRETERERDRERETERERQRERDTERDTERERQRETEGERISLYLYRSMNIG